MRNQPHTHQRTHMEAAGVSIHASTTRGSSNLGATLRISSIQRRRLSARASRLPAPADALKGCRLMAMFVTCRAKCRQGSAGPPARVPRAMRAVAPDRSLGQVRQDRRAVDAPLRSMVQRRVTRTRYATAIGERQRAGARARREARARCRRCRATGVRTRNGPRRHRPLPGMTTRPAMRCGQAATGGRTVRGNVNRSMSRVARIMDPSHGADHRTSKLWVLPHDEPKVGISRRLSRAKYVDA